ncbi:effector-associated constant component EACC1 [Streptomyces mirabilis]|uniref:effector-associated constant component EACC1 n=1 Tax=Streptomyces mirabilis TaxID=68239 RepID=UPI002E2D687A|nr:hypothetical protein [Streptomyces mirabilis]
MRVMADDVTQEVMSLYRWLCDDEEATRNATVSLAEDTRPGELGLSIEEIEFLISSGFNAGSLLLAIANWRSSRQHASPVRIELGRPGRTIVTVAEDTPEAIERAVRILQAAIAEEVSRNAEEG